jgi:hypothetical protein
MREARYKSADQTQSAPEPGRTKQERKEVGPKAPLFFGHEDLRASFVIRASSFVIRHLD